MVRVALRRSALFTLLALAATGCDDRTSTVVPAIDAGSPPDASSAPDASVTRAVPVDVRGAFQPGWTGDGMTSTNPYAHGFAMRVVGSHLIYGAEVDRSSIIAALPLPLAAPPSDNVPIVVAEVRGTFRGPWIGEDVVAWADSSKVYSSPIPPATSPTVIAQVNLSPLHDRVDVARAIDRERIFGLSYDASSVDWFPLSGQASGPVLLGAAITKQRATTLLVDADPNGFLFLATSGSSATDRGQLERLPKTGAGSATVLASIPKITVSSVVRDGPDFFVAGYSLTGGAADDLAGAIYRVPVGGGSPKVLFDKLTEPTNLLVHGDSLIWASNRRDRSKLVLRGPVGGGQPETLYEDPDLTVGAMAVVGDRLLVAGTARGTGRMLSLATE